MFSVTDSKIGLSSLASEILIGKESVERSPDFIANQLIKATQI